MRSTELIVFKDSLNCFVLDKIFLYGTIQEIKFNQLNNIKKHR